MTEQLTEITIKLNDDGIWEAFGNIHADVFLGLGDTPEEALAEFLGICEWDEEKND